IFVDLDAGAFVRARNAGDPAHLIPSKSGPLRGGGCLAGIRQQLVDDVQSCIRRARRAARLVLKLLILKLLIGLICRLRIVRIRKLGAETGGIGRRRERLPWSSSRLSRDRSVRNQLAVGIDPESWRDAGLDSTRQSGRIRLTGKLRPRI